MLKRPCIYKDAKMIIRVDKDDEFFLKENNLGHKKT